MGIQIVSLFHDTCKECEEQEDTSVGLYLHLDEQGICSECRETLDTETDESLKNNRHYYQSFSDLLPYQSVCNRTYKHTILLSGADGKFASDCISTKSRPSPTNVPHRYDGRKSCTQPAGMHSDYL